MKRLLSSLLAAIACFISMPSVSAATPVIRIVDVPHRNFDGTFRDNDLATTLTPDGRLGKLLLQSNSAAT